MNRKLYFLRHAVAVEREDWQGKDDELRPLTEQGVKETQQLAKYLVKLNFEVEQIFTSPLVRAHDTAKIVAEVLRIPLAIDENLKPGCDFPAFRNLLDHHKFKSMMLVGHEPDFGGMIMGLIGGGSIKMKKGALAYVELKDEKTQHGVLRWLLPPDLLAK